MDIECLEVTESGEMRWDVTLPASGQLHSSVFSYLHNECRLNLLNDGTHYCLLLTFLEKCGSFNDSKPESLFNITVEVEGQFWMDMVPELSEATMVHRASVYCLWRRSIDDVTRATRESPDYPQLRFFMTLQTDDCKSISTSVQTLLDMRNFPCIETLSEDLAKILDEGSDTDVEFQHDDHCTKAHRTIVCARSPVLARMLHNDMTEAKTGVVRIPDMEPDIIKRFFRYLYTGRLDELTFDVAMSLYEAGDKYEVRGLVKRCSNFLMQHLTVKNACDVLVVADAHSDAVFVDKVIDYMMETKVPLMSDHWSDFCDDHPKLANKVLNRFCKGLGKADLRECNL